jgi:nicotinamidase/pyrazinamidase
MPYGEQTLWPDHCIQGTQGAEFHSDLRTDQASLIIRKGMNPAIDSYSAFYENDHTTGTGLAGYLRDHRIERVVCTGLAFDYCVFYSAQDAVKEKFNTVVVTDACRAIDMEGSVKNATDAMTASGVELVGSEAL